MDRPMDRDDDALELDEKRVADAIEGAISQPAGIEAEAMLEAAELEELKFKHEPG